MPEPSLADAQDQAPRVKAVLVIDDERDVLETAVQMLEAIGYVVMGANTGEKALRILDVADVDVIVSDVMMPGLNGLELLQLAKRKKPWVKVVLITGYYAPELVSAARQGGARACLEKPLDLDRLAHAVQTALEPLDEREETGSDEPRLLERRLVAILSADVQGYSRLMHDDDLATVQTLKAYRDIMVRLIRYYRGRVVDSPGDNLLAEFASVVDAVQCGVSIQQQLRARNEPLPDHRKMEFRIGINIGDVLVDGGRIYGDSVNMAARLESLAAGGGLCVSEAVYEQIKTKLALSYEHLGPRAAKNIAEPFPVYSVQLPAHPPDEVIRDRS